MASLQKKTIKNLRRDLNRGTRKRGKHSAGKKRGGLNKTEKTQTRAIAKKVATALTETRWCNPYSYDAYAGMSLDLPRQNPQLEFPCSVTGVNQTGNSAFVLGLETGQTISTNGALLNAALPPIGVGNDCINMIGMYNFSTEADGMTNNLDPTICRSGEYMMAQSQRVDIDVCMRKVEDMIDIARAFTPYQFRVVIVKRRPRRVVADGTPPDFRTELFRNYANATVGFTNGMSVKQLFDFKINREAFTVIKDIKFKLSPQLDPDSNHAVPGDEAVFPSTGNTYNSFPNVKSLSFYLPKPKQKIKWDGQRNGDPVDSFNYKVNIFVIASQTGSENMENAGDRWIMRVQTESKFKDI